jgi:hypothetical protein
MARTEPQTEQTEQEQLAAQAVRELKALTKVPGALKVITAETAASAYLVAEGAVAHFVCHDVVRIEGPDDRGRYTAHTAEGDTCTGYPAALLRRLRQASTER